MYLRGYTAVSIVGGVLQLGLFAWRWAAFQGPHRFAVILEAGLVALAFLAMWRISLKTERSPQGMLRVGWGLFLIAVLHGTVLIILHDNSLKTINLILLAVAAPLLFPRTFHFLVAFLCIFGAWLGTLAFVKPYHFEPWGIAWFTALGLACSIHIFLLRLFGDLERAEERDRRLIREKTRLVAELRTAMENLSTLQGLIPICAQCKKVRNDGGYWEQVEVFINSQTGRQLTHGYCPECYADALMELEILKAELPKPTQ